jgi:type I restriction enzyme R subunit
LGHIILNENITDRYYQKEAIKAVCETFDRRNKRKALLVMATGSGKTRAVISLVNALIENGWVKNFLFLADRNSLVTQAKRAFTNLMPNLTLTNLVEEKDNYNARGVFSTYQTMVNCIDSSTDELNNKLYTCGHFDLIIIDEAHRSIYNKYRDIFNYFDACLVGLTATPKKDIDKNTYEIFELEDGVPTYGYELAQAVKDGFLVDYRSIGTKLKFMHEGIVYDQLSEREKQEYEAKFTDEDGNVPDIIGGSALNEWVFNKDTIKQVLNILMTKGLKVDYGGKTGKTIIFAKSHLHAEKILEVWNQEYPHYPRHYARVIDNYANYAQSLIDAFSSPEKMPQITISVDMMDTGIDVPEVLNLVFFKKVMSKAKFWQMIGRGTRLCPGLIDGENKKEFYIFDFCSNFEFFRENKHGAEAPRVHTIQEQLFNLKADLAFKLQEAQFQTDFLKDFRAGLVVALLDKVKQLNRNNFTVRQHIRFIDVFSREETYQSLTFENILDIQEHIAPLTEPEDDEYSALRFDVLIYALDIAYTTGKEYKRAKNDLLKKAQALAKYSTIPAITEQKEFINTLINTEYLKNAGIAEFEAIRQKLRGLMKYIEKEAIARYDTNFDDNIIQILENPSELESDDLQDYKKKVNYYIRQHQDNPVIAKLRSNLPLSKGDITELEKILWSEVGTKDDYTRGFGGIPLGELVRSIVGLDRQAAKAAFSKFIDDVNLDQKQIYFVNQIIEYIVQNGVLKNLNILQSSPFTDRGTVAELFPNTNVWFGIRDTITNINNNAMYK